MTDINSENSVHSPQKHRNFSVHFKRYLLIWVIVWVVTIVLSILPEYIPGMVILDPGADPKTCPYSPRPLSGLGGNMSIVVPFEIVVGLCWALISYWFHTLWIDMLNTRLRGKTLIVIATILSASTIALTVGGFLGRLSYKAANVSYFHQSYSRFRRSNRDPLRIRTQRHHGRLSND
jgi:hypothetical protein